MEQSKLGCTNKKMHPSLRLSDSLFSENSIIIGVTDNAISHVVLDISEMFGKTRQGWIGLDDHEKTIAIRGSEEMIADFASIQNLNFD